MEKIQKTIRHSIHVSIVTVLILTLTIVGIGLTLSESYAEDNNWYVGEGVKQDMYVTYAISNFDTNSGREFQMTIYFEKQDENGNWLAPVYVIDRGKVIEGTFTLSPLDLTALGTSDIPPEMVKYRSAYSNSLQWLSAFVPKPGQSLNAGSWGKIASIGGSEIKPIGTQQLNIQAFPQPIEASIIEHYKGVSNKNWILNEFPYPVMAKTFADVTTGNPPVQFSFLLLETGTGKPVPPESMELNITPPVTERTERGDYFIRLGWDPHPITTNIETIFTVELLDKDQFELFNVAYDMKITDNNNTKIIDLKNQFAKLGVGEHAVTFESPGTMNVEITIKSISGVGTGVFIEKVDFVLGVLDLS